MTLFITHGEAPFLSFEQLLIVIRERGELAVTLDDLLETFDGDLDGSGGVLAHVLIEAGLFALLVQTTWKQEPQRQPSAEATTNIAADSISLALTPRRFQLSHFCRSS